MALQGFVDKVGPVISATWLNVVDVLKFTVFEDAATKAAARKALMSGLENYANDAAASAGGVAVGELYRNGSIVMVRVV